MLFATDKFILSFGDTAKLTIQYENTTLTNTGKKQAIVEASKDGYTWIQVASIAPKSSLPLKIEALYVRLTTDTTISVVNTNPIPRDTKKSDIAVNINTKALVTKDDLQAYVSKNELNDLVHHPDLSGFVTKSQVQQMIPEIPTLPDITRLASKESVELKANKKDVDDLKLTVVTKADTTTMAALETTVTKSVIPAITHLNTIKADKTELSALAEQVAQSEATVGTLATQVTSFQSALDDRVTKSQAEDANRVLLNAIAARATAEQLNTVHDEVKQKANQQQVNELVNKAFHLEQDKANKAEFIELTKTVTLLESLISGEIDPTLLKDIKTDVLAMINPELPALVKQVLTDTGTAETLEQIKAAIAGIYNDKANTKHTHTMSDVTGLDAALSSKAATKHSHTMDNVLGLQEALNSKSPTNHTHTWESITGKPTTFNPTTHGHSVSDITGLQAQLDSKLAKQEAEATYAKKTELPQSVNLSGYATKGELATKANTAHSHAVADIDGLQKALDGKAPTSHSHSWDSITGKPTTFAPSTHTHNITDVSGLQAALDAKAPATHNHDWNSITNKPTTFAPSSHTHAWTQITGVPTSNTSVAGIVQLNDTLTSTSTDQALTAKQGKALHSNKLDKTANAVSASRLATARNIALTGAVTGSVNFDGSDDVSIATTLNLADFANSKEENGYQELPNGLIIQWGKYTARSYLGERSVSIVFPIAFPSQCLNVFTTMHMVQHSSYGDGGALVISTTPTGATLSLQAFNTSVGELRGFGWLAIGY